MNHDVTTDWAPSAAPEKVVKPLVNNDVFTRELVDHLPRPDDLPADAPLDEGFRHQQSPMGN